MSEAEGGGLVPREILIGITVDAWKLARAFERMVSRMSPDERPKYAGQLRYFERQAVDALASAGLSLVSIAGQPFDAGAAATPLNISDFGPNDALVVDQMIEPIVMDANGVVRTGTVLLAKAQ